MATTAVEIDTTRLWNTVTELGEIGDIGDGAMMRVTGSEADRQARDLIVSWFEAAGLTIRVDPVGNIIGRRQGRTDRPPVMTGSHVDTVPRGGKFDGTAGVLTALEAVRAWNHAGVETERPVEVVAFTEEEGTRFGTGLLGSLVATGQLSYQEALEKKDEDGNTVGEVLANISYAGSDEFDVSEAAAFVELHVEQGPTLEATGHDIGIVENITGVSHTQVSFTGEANHAGTTSMALRRDAFMGAAEFALDLESAVRDYATETTAVGTVGKVEVSPSGTNVVPGTAELSIDIRDTDEESRQALVEEAKQRSQEIAVNRDLEVQWKELLNVPVTELDDGIVANLETVCEAAGVDATRMSSGAGHDAMNVASVAPAGMLFVPSEDGISHSPAEYTPPEELATGARVLERGLRSLADS